jgi:hypothetical protein
MESDCTVLFQQFHFSRSSTISILPNLAAHPSAVEQMSSSARVQISSALDEDGGLFHVTLPRKVVHGRDAQPVGLARIHPVLKQHRI